MNTYLLIFILSAVSSLVLTPTVRRVCERYGLLDVPRDERRVHRKSVPRLGGVAIFLAALIALSALPFVHNSLTRSLGVIRWRFFAVLIPATLVFLFGVYDDLRGSKAPVKFLVQALAGGLLYALGGRIEVLSVPFVGTIELPVVLSVFLTILWTVAISNAFNLIDGMDGLAAGAALFASFVMMVVSLSLYNPFVTVISIALAGALIGFLRYNFNPASIFLGDSGALFIGFTLAALAVQGTQKASTVVAVMIPLLAFGVPMVDTGFTMVRRFLSGRPLFQGDREHIHHMLLARGWSQKRVAFVLYGACALFGLMAMLFVGESGRTTGLMLFVIGVAVVLAVGRLRYHEIDEIKASMKRNLGDRRVRAANNLRVRRATRAISEARTLQEMFDAMQKMLEFGEFVYAVAQLGHAEDAERNQSLLAREQSANTVRRAEMHKGLIRWTWERGDIEAGEIVGSGHFWTLRLPLSTERGAWGYVNLYRGLDSDALMLDINYLCHLFQREMSCAAERILTTDDRHPVSNVPPQIMSATK
ncbi:MAG: undecaprenyl/decaprenyl-phosphate alpha-N-acetylglucosaminyl 1-phosphate transferase [Pyrinomonadaceae bacterium]|nr:undecaprenyl/decaprenyl-phosphate alpha-N-acetylglucosaminyl 1-phosphate transferase [Pyrinomonadaceae bacterium]